MISPLQVVADRRAVRAWFPSLQKGFAYLENAGGSQVPEVVADAIRDYMLSTYVQLGAGYPQSVVATDTVAEAHAFIEEFMNVGATGRVVLGPSTTALTNLIATAYSKIIQPGDEVIIADANHEANAGCWARLQDVGAVLKFWKVNPETFESSLVEFEKLLSSRTKLVAVAHVSNLLGMVVDVKGVCELAHRVGAKVCVDGVAFASHRAIDVQEIGADWYVYSTYKVYGPHMAAIFGTHEAFEELTGPNHYFIPKTQMPYKWELGGVSHEGCAGLLALKPYLGFLAGGVYEGRQTVVDAFAVAQALESEPYGMLLEFLQKHPRIRMIGAHSLSGASVPTVAFLHDSKPSSQVAHEVNEHGIGIRNGNMYAVRLCENLGIDLVEGVVRISLVHYNSPEEIQKLIGVLEGVL